MCSFIIMWQFLNTLHPHCKFHFTLSNATIHFICQVTKSNWLPTISPLITKLTRPGLRKLKSCTSSAPLFVLLVASVWSNPKRWAAAWSRCSERMVCSRCLPYSMVAKYSSWRNADLLNLLKQKSPDGTCCWNQCSIFCAQKWCSVQSHSVCARKNWVYPHDCRLNWEDSMLLIWTSLHVEVFPKKTQKPCVS